MSVRFTLSAFQIRSNSGRNASLNKVNVSARFCINPLQLAVIILTHPHFQVSVSSIKISILWPDCPFYFLVTLEFLESKFYESEFLTKHYPMDENRVLFLSPCLFLYKLMLKSEGKTESFQQSLRLITNNTK